MSEINVGDKVYRNPEDYNFWWEEHIDPPDSSVIVLEIEYIGSHILIRFKDLYGEEYGSDIKKFYKKDKYDERIKRLKSL